MALFLFPRVWHYETGRHYVRRQNRISHPRLRGLCPYPFFWQPIRRLMPGLWVSAGSQINLDGYGFRRGKYREPTPTEGEGK